MSEMTPYQNARNIVMGLEPNFEKLAKQHGVVNFAAEANFALQVLSSNDYACKMARNNPSSLKMAIMNVAAVGLSLNPIDKHAYLIPRDGRIMLDVSYMGYLHLAVASGSILWGKAEIVYEKDEFIFNGAGNEPGHKVKNYFSDRGGFVGVYVVCKTPDGSFLTEIMTAEEVFRIRDRSVSYKSYQKTGRTSPWVTDQGEMIKKTVIKRAAKTWPRKGNDQRLNAVIDNSNKLDGIDFEMEKVAHITAAARDDEKHLIELRKVKHPEEFKHGPYYRVTHGKFKGQQLLNVDLVEIEFEKNRIEKVMATKESFPTWYEHTLKAFNNYIAFYDEYQKTIVTDDEIEDN